MHISKFEVSNFRSITKSQIINLGLYNVIVGKNNIGKSNLIDALVLALNLIKESSYSKIIRGSRLGRIRNERIQYNRERDFPLNIPNSEKKSTIFRVTLELNDKEKEELLDLYNINVLKDLTLRFVFNSSNIGQYDVIMRGKANRKFNDNKHIIARYISEKLNPIYIPCIRDANLSEKAFEAGFRSKLAKLDEDEEYKNCLRILFQKQNGVLQEYLRNIKDIVSIYIPSVKEIEYNFQSDISLRRILDGHIAINDGVKTSLELKGDGIKSLTAIALYSYNLRLSENNVLCIEEPESHLHSDAIYGIKKILKESSENSQIIISTHSVLLVDKECVSNNIIVSDKSVRHAKSLQEIKELLGVHISDEYLGNEVVVLVEGKSDKRFIESLIKRHPKYDQLFESGKLKIVNLVGASKASYYLTFLNSLMISTFVVLDNDQSPVICRR